MWDRCQGIRKVLGVLGVQDKGVIPFECCLIPTARRGVLNQVGPEGGWYKLGQVTALPTSLVSECILDFVKQILVGGLHCAICVHPGEGDDSSRAVHN